MHKFELKSSKKMYRLERLSDFYFEINSNSLPSEKIIISDLRNLFIGPRTNFCDFCFKHRYLCYLSEQTFLGGQNSALPENWQEFLSEDFFDFVDNALETSEHDLWNLWDLKSSEGSAFELIPYDMCDECFPRKNVELSLDSEVNQEGSILLDKFLNKLKSCPVKDNSELFKFLFEDSFGFVSYFNTFAEAGFGDKDLEKSLDAHCVSTLLSVMPTSRGGSETVMCGAQDTDEEISKIKAVMEFIERYSLHNLIFKSQEMHTKEELEELEKKFSIVDVSSFLNLFDSKVTTSKGKESLYSDLVWSVDIVNASKALLPLNCLYSIGKISFIRPSSSGFAAHYDSNKALESSVLELIERDSFFRFWFKPETAEVLELNSELQGSLDNVIKMLKVSLGNDHLQAKVLLLKSPLDVPVAFAYITSDDLSKPPALISGFGASLELDDAIYHALKELRIGGLNLIARFQKDSSWIDEKIDFSSFENMKTPQDHMYFYHHPSVKSHVKFLKYFEDKEPTLLFQNIGPKNLDELRDAFKKNNMHWYAIDATPVVFEKYGVFVVRSFSPELYPLQFGANVAFDMNNISSVSVAKEMPHLFT
ncbi:YcaO-like family protein [Candidatus Babeliales bacterium]|nr:YcaO-like family protein [Candidatus Babeliales bacterium]